MENMGKEEFQNQVELLYPRLHRAMTIYLNGSNIEPEDILQETFLKAWRNRSRFEGKSNFYTWIYSIARNLCIDEFRKQKHEKNRSDTPADEFEFSSDLFSSGYEREEILLLRKAISKLPEELRLVVVMKAIDGMSYKEISDVSDINEQTLKSRMFRARKILASTLKNMGVNES